MTDIEPGVRFDGRPACGQRRSLDGIEMCTQWPHFDIAAVLITGEIDAANTREVLEYVLSKALLCSRLILDLRQIDFFACDGYLMLKTLEKRCAVADVELEVLHSRYGARMHAIFACADRRSQSTTAR